MFVSNAINKHSNNFHMNFTFISRLLLLFFLSTNNVLASEKALIFVSIPPMQYLMQRIAGDKIEVRSLLDSSDNAELYEPTPSQLRSIVSATLYFPLNMPFEKKWLPVVKENNPSLIVADCCDDLTRVFVKNKHSRHQIEKDPHIWIDPVINRDIARRMRDALISLFPKRENVLVKNHAQLDKELELLHEEILSSTKKLQNRTFIVSHPAWSYFSERYGFNQVPLEYEGKEIGVRSTVKLVELAKEKKINTIFVQRQIKSNPAVALAKEINAEIIELDPLAHDHINNLRLTAKLISDSMRD